MTELKEIQTGFNMDVGAPSPTIVSTDRCIFLAFYLQDENEAENFFPLMRNSVNDTGTTVIEFSHFLNYKLGFPNDEALHWHPFAKLGLEPYGFFELIDSPWLHELWLIEKNHEYARQDNWKKYKHFIITFKEKMFECIATGFTVWNKEATSIKARTTEIVEHLFLDEI